MKQIATTTEKLISQLFSSTKIFYESETFFDLGFLQVDIHESHDSGEKERPILISLYHLHPLCEHVDIRRTIATESYFLHIASDRTRTGNLWLPSAGFITGDIYLYVYIYIYMCIVEHKVCSVTSKPTQSSSRRVSSLKDSLVLLTTEW